MSDLHPIRAFRDREKISLEKLADLLVEQGIERPSVAKLSRIETGQPCPVDLVAPLERITGVPAKDIRPDLARLFLHTMGDSNEMEMD
jgi:hypothetical protein